MRDTNDWWRGVVALLLTAGVALAGSGVAVGAEEGGSASFEDDSLTVTRGEVLEVTVTHSETAHVHLGGERSGYLLEVKLEGSGTHTIRLDTYRSATNDASQYVTGGEATVRSDDLSQSLVATKYLMNVTVGGVERDLGHFVIEERDPASATAHVAPGAVDPEEAGLDGLRDAMTPRTTVARGDYAVLRFDAPGLSSALNESDLAGGAAAEGIEVRFTRTDAGPNVEESFLATPENGTRVVSNLDDADREGDEILLVWNTSTLPAAEDPRRYAVTMELDATHNHLVSEDVTLTRTDLAVVPPTLSLSADPGFILPPWNESTLAVAGSTNLAPGTDLELRARSEAPDTFLQPRATAVNENGTFGATFDFAGVSRGVTFPLWVLGYRDQTERTVTLQEEAANVTFRDQTTRGTGVTVASVTLSAGGFVVVQDDRVGLRGASSYLPPGTHRDVRVALLPTLGGNATLYAVPYADLNGNGTFDSAADRAYAPNQTPVLAAANVTLARVARTPTPTPTPAPTTAAAPTTAEPTLTPLPVREESPLTPIPDGGGGLLPFPLPGPLSGLGGRIASVAAVVGAGVLAFRRRS